jgi:hypothetical protein
MPINGSLKFYYSAVAVVSIFLVAGNVMALEEPSYEVLKNADGYEIRRYPSVVVAELEVGESFERAGNAAFRPLAAFINGANSAAEKIEMTAPVMQQSAGDLGAAGGDDTGEKIEMTAPVMQRPAGSGGYALQFVMPGGYTLENVPRPTDGRITVREEPGRVVAVYRYSGTWSERRYRDRLARLRAALARDGLEATGDPVWARFNSPFMIWFLRRNEIWLPLAWSS